MDNSLFLVDKTALGYCRFHPSWEKIKTFLKVSNNGGEFVPS